MKMAKNANVRNSNMAQNAVFAVCSKMKMAKNANVRNSNMAQNLLLSPLLSELADGGLYPHDKIIG